MKNLMYPRPLNLNQQPSALEKAMKRPLNSSHIHNLLGHLQRRRHLHPARCGSPTRPARAAEALPSKQDGGDRRQRNGTA